MRKIQWVFLAVVLCALVVLGWGQWTPLTEPILGDVPSKSLAFEAGFRSGDRILRIDGLAVPSWEFFLSEIFSRPMSKIQVVVDRVSNGEVEIVFTSGVRNAWFFSYGYLEGLSSAVDLPVVALKSGSLLSRLGVRTGFVLEKVNGKSIKVLQDIDAVIQQQDFSRPLNLDFVYEENGVSLKHSIAVPEMKAQYSAASLGIEEGIPHVKKVYSQSIAQKIGILPSDKILLVQGMPTNKELALIPLAKQVQIEKKMTVVVVRGEHVHHLRLDSPNVQLPSLKTSLPDFLGYQSYVQKRPLPLTDSKNVFLKIKSVFILAFSVD